MSPLDAELVRTLAGASLVILRAWAILRAQILWSTAIGRLWWVIAAALALVTAPLGVAASAPASIPTSVVGFALAAVAELLLGTAIGTVASLPGYALVGSATASAKVLRVGSRPFVALTLALVLASSLALGLHRPLLTALAGLGTLLPVGDPAAWVDLLRSGALATLGRGLTALLVLSLAFATPVLLTAVIVDLAVGVVRGGPAPADDTLRPLQHWARFAAVLVALGASWAAFPAAWGRALQPPW